MKAQATCDSSMTSYMVASLRGDKGCANWACREGERAFGQLRRQLKWASADPLVPTQSHEVLRLIAWRGLPLPLPYCRDLGA
jgi:hypothetical protein